MAGNLRAKFGHARPSGSRVIRYQLFSKIIRNPCHILNQLLPSVSAAAENYNLRPCKHNRLLSERATRLFGANFIYRNLYCDIY